jgi:hypothetical protein
VTKSAGCGSAIHLMPSRRDRLLAQCRDHRRRDRAARAREGASDPCPIPVAPDGSSTYSARPDAGRRQGRRQSAILTRLARSRRPRAAVPRSTRAATADLAPENAAVMSAAWRTNWRIPPKTPANYRIHLGLENRYGCGVRKSLLRASRTFRHVRPSVCTPRAPRPPTADVSSDRGGDPRNSALDGDSAEQLAGVRVAREHLGAEGKVVALALVERPHRQASAAAST